MCGRFTLHHTEAVLSDVFELTSGHAGALSPRYNIAPTQPIAVVRSAETGRTLTSLLWGLIPSWSKDQKIASRLINARSETVAEKPSFRSAFKHRRCLIPASGYYEWKKQTDAVEKSAKVPHYIAGASDEPLAFAGLWEQWRSPDGTELESCTILTTDANPFLTPIHHRMPVILQDPAQQSTWLDTTTDATDLAELLCPHEPALSAYPVSTLVNKASFDNPSCIEHLE